MTYNGTRQPLVEAAYIGSTAMTDNLPSIEYSLDGNTWSQNIPTGLNAGDYTVWYRVNENNYYEGTDGTDTVPVTIHPAPANINIQWNDSVKYVANTNQVFVDAVTADSDQVPLFKIYPEGDTGESLLFSTEYPSAMVAGKYIVEWYLPEGANHKGSGEPLNPNIKIVEIEKAMASDVNKISVTGDTWTYDETQHTVTVANADGWDLTFTDANGNTSSTLPVATNAGTYTYSWTATHDAFDTETGSVTLLCNKAPVFVTQAPIANSAQVTCRRIIYRTRTGETVRIEYEPNTSQQISATIVTGKCTYGGVIHYTGTFPYTYIFNPGESGTRISSVSWTATPISDNYYIEGTASGTITIKLTCTLTTHYVTVG